jgi:phage tail sheath protein FI
VPTYLSPGVYVEEVSSGSAPIAGAGTSVAGFIGIITGTTFITIEKITVDIENTGNKLLHI